MIQYYMFKAKNLYCNSANFVCEDRQVSRRFPEMESPG